MDFIIEQLQPADWTQIAAIYLAGIETGIATFQKDVPTWAEWDQEHCQDCRLVARSGDTVLGWAALTPVSSRCVYSGIVEASVYISKTNRGKGIGAALLNKLLRDSEEAGYWSLQGEIIKENIPSRELCRKCGFREIGYRERFGKMPNGEWHDVVLVERRSKIAGI